MNPEKFDIISFTADSRRYYPASSGRSSWMGEEYVAHTEIEIPLGASRIGGPVVDLPKGIAYPTEFRFAAQLDLAVFSTYDKSGVLPKKGYLYVFVHPVEDRGTVIYAEVEENQLIRKIKEHEDHFWEGILIEKVYSDTEQLSERYQLDEGQQQWDYFAGSQRSKVFGIFTHCQWEEEDVLATTYSDQLLLLQIGENGFNDEGVFSLLINREDLAARNFEACKFYWGQS